MKHYEVETVLDQDHDLDWVAWSAVHDDLPTAPAERTVWAEGEWHLSALAEDGTWVKLCGPNVHKLQGKQVRVVVEDAEDPGVQAIRDRAPEVVTEYVEKWKRSRARDGDDEWCKSMRWGWVQVIAALLGQSFRVVNIALEEGKL